MGYWSLDDLKHSMCRGQCLESRPGLYPERRIVSAVIFFLLCIITKPIVSVDLLFT